MSKNKKKKNKGEKSSWESHAYACKRSQVEHRHSHFFMSKNKYRNKTREKGAAGELCTQVQEVTRLSTGTPIFYVQKQKNKTREKSPVGRVMHIHARGHRFEPCNSHFLCPKTEKIREKGTAGESCTYVQEVTRLSTGTPIFYAQKQKRNKTTDFTRNIIGRYGTISSFFV